MKTKQEFENAVYEKCNIYKNRRRKIIASAASSCAAFILCLTVVFVFAKQKNFDEGICNSAAGTEHVSFSAALITQESIDRADISAQSKSQAMSFETEIEAAGSIAGESEEVAPSTVSALLYIEKSCYSLNDSELAEIQELFSEIDGQPEGTSVSLTHGDITENHILSENDLERLIEIVSNKTEE